MRQAGGALDWKHTAPLMSILGNAPEVVVHPPGPRSAPPPAPAPPRQGAGDIVKQLAEAEAQKQNGATDENPDATTQDEQ